MIEMEPSTSAPTLVVLAAGMGARYGGLKQLEAVGPAGEVILDFSVRDAIAAGFGKIVFVIRREFADAFSERVVSRYQSRICTAVCFQELDDLPGGVKTPEGRSKPWGTAHAVYAARKALSGPFAVINADDFYGRGAFVSIARMISTFDSQEPRLGLVAYRLDRTLSENGGVNRGICRVDQGELKGISEHLDIRPEADGRITGIHPDGKRIALERDSLVSMNFWGFNLKFLEVIEEEFKRFLKTQRLTLKAECYLPHVVDQHLASTVSASCSVMVTEENWFGVTYPADRAKVVSALQTLIDQGQYPVI